MTTLTDRVEGLTTQMTILTTQVAALVDAQHRTEQQVATSALAVHGLTDDMGKAKGKGLEAHYRLYGSPFFGVLLPHPH
jgi:hypothetical protein